MRVGRASAGRTCERRRASQRRPDVRTEKSADGLSSKETRRRDHAGPKEPAPWSPAPPGNQPMGGQASTGLHLLSAISAKDRWRAADAAAEMFSDPPTLHTFTRMHTHTHMPPWGALAVTNVATTSLAVRSCDSTAPARRATPFGHNGSKRSVGSAPDPLDVPNGRGVGQSGIACRRRLPPTLSCSLPVTISYSS